MVPTQMELFLKLGQPKSLVIRQLDRQLLVSRVSGQLMPTVRLESRWRRVRFGGKMYLASHVERPGSNWVGEDR